MKNLCIDTLYMYASAKLQHNNNNTNYLEMYFKTNLLKQLIYWYYMQLQEIL